MVKSGWIALSVLLLNAVAIHAAAGEASEPKIEMKSYTISCSVIRKAQVENANGKKSVENVGSPIPDIKTLEGARAEYRSGGKLGSAAYGFELRVKVKTVSATKARLEVTAEDSSAEGSGLNPLIQVKRLHVARIVTLGKPLKLEPDRNANGEGTWVELKVQETEEE